MHRLLGHKLGNWSHWHLTSKVDAADESDVAEGNNSSSEGGEEDDEDNDEDDDNDNENDTDLTGLHEQSGNDSKDDEVHSPRR